MKQTASLASRFARMSRRSFIAAGAALPAVPTAALAHERASPPNDNRLWYRQPAVRWEEALPVGNGRLGAMVFGRVAQERLQLNEDTLWAGSPYAPESPEAFEALADVRRLIDEGKFKEAADLASARIMARPLRRRAPRGRRGRLADNRAKHLGRRHSRGPALRHPCSRPDRR